MPTKALPSFKRAGSSENAKAANGFSRVPSAGTYAHERDKAAENLRQTLELLGKGKNSVRFLNINVDPLTRLPSGPVIGAD